jgi:hypothetical protein
VFRIDITDNGESGRGHHRFQLRLSNGYDSGEQTSGEGTSKSSNGLHCRLTPCSSSPVSIESAGHGSEHQRANRAD